ncbi:hypothetical protein EDF23_10251 [Curtobacterium sp. PhB128]|nr:hypothetical protein EDF23_10251 [Curtobacterium sp. PhB128]TCL98165.1 hypothetical protein EDF29_102399 [Curtobacterium sp. PhB138]
MFVGVMGAAAGTGVVGVTTGAIAVGWTSTANEVVKSPAETDRL